MAYREDEEKRIYELETAESLSAGTFVPVDKEGNEMAEKFDLGTVLGEKVDAPSTAPEAGQVLTFDGTENTWANPPEGVYVINYSEVTDLRDIDVDRIKTQPTFLKIDTVEPILIPITNSSGPYTVGIQPGTIMSVDEIGSDGTVDESIYHYSYNGPRYVVFTTGNGSSTAGGIMQNAVLKITCLVSLSPFGGVSKTIGINGFLNNNGGLFNSMPTPTTFQCFSGRGTGTINVENKDRNALQINIMSGSNIRSHCLLPLDIQNHDFSTDTTPEQIQFMGWGSTSNRAGYKTINEVPTSTAQDEGKVLTVDSNGAAAWSDTKTFIAVYHTTPFADILAAYNSGRQVLLDIGGNVLLSVFSIGSSNVMFTTLSPGTPNSPPVFFNTSVDDQNVWTAIKTYKGPALTVHTLSDSPSIQINGLNNGFGTITLNQATFTLQVVVEDGETINFALEVTNQQQCQVTIQKKVGNTVTTLKHSVAAGNTMEANTTYQITAVGNCWTLAEFEA